jgi:hypothetical protein
MHHGRVEIITLTRRHRVYFVPIADDLGRGRGRMRENETNQRDRGNHFHDASNKQ